MRAMKQTCLLLLAGLTRRCTTQSSNLTNVATQVVAGVNYNLTFTTAPTDCRIGQVQYSATQCVPAGPVNGKCTAIVYVVPWMNTTEVTSYTCSNASN
ncbi:hypothetical protein MTO96_039959 [Rhipicephalus appendiculatus]